jgi:hypothetical protein
MEDGIKPKPALGIEAESPERVPNSSLGMSEDLQRIARAAGNAQKQIQDARFKTQKIP